MWEILTAATESSSDPSGGVVQTQKKQYKQNKPLKVKNMAFNHYFNSIGWHLALFSWFWGLKIKEKSLAESQKVLCGSAFFVSKWRLCSTAVCAIIILKKMKRKRKDIRIVLRKFKKREVLCMKKRSLNKIKRHCCEAVPFLHRYERLLHRPLGGMTAAEAQLMTGW